MNIIFWDDGVFTYNIHQSCLIRKYYRLMRMIVHQWITRKCCISTITWLNSYIFLVVARELSESLEAHQSEVLVDEIMIRLSRSSFCQSVFWSLFVRGQKINYRTLTDLLFSTVNLINEDFISNEDRRFQLVHNYS